MMETYVRARIDAALKDEATAVLRDCGLTISAAFRLFLGQVVEEQRLPLEIKRPSARLRAAMQEADEIAAKHGSHFDDIDDMLGSLGHGEGKQEKQQGKGRAKKTG
ncbi:type II toxin-antitoxin system RelB/DinJ family antitoxin [Chimaeribacter californicus]|nr:type II toxin-antitoxin system RelB/DinJ family antitoxin [Chimaeribacter californicus]